MFVTFQPVEELKGESVANELVVINLDHVQRMRFRDKAFGYKQVSLQLDLANGQTQWVYLAPENAFLDEIGDRLNQLNAIAKGDALTSLDEPIFSSEDDADVTANE